MTRQLEAFWETGSGGSAGLTLLQDLAEVLAVAGAVPAAEAKLVLALPDPQLGALGHLLHNLRFQLAQLRLLPRQPLRLAADAVGVHDQGAPHCPAGGTASRAKPAPKPGRGRVAQPVLHSEMEWGHGAVPAQH